MVFLISVFLCCVAIMAIWAVYKILMYIASLVIPEKNPYIEAHRERLKNDRNYDEYLNWCDNLSEVPDDKEDSEVERNILKDLKVKP